MKTVYLTIDDGPSVEFKQKVDFLLSKKIPAILFCRGKFLEERPDDAAYAIKRGFVIGNHTYSHPHASKLSNEEEFAEIEKMDKMIEEVYKKADVKRPAKVFRFPYGDKGFGENFEKGWPKEKREHTQAIQDLLIMLGYKQPKFEGINYKWYKNAKLENDADVVWTYDTHDWRLYRGLDKLQDIFNRMDEDVPEGCMGLNYPNSNEVIIMHDHPNNFDYFKQIIEKLLEKEIKFEMPKF